LCKKFSTAACQNFINLHLRPANYMSCSSNLANEIAEKHETSRRSKIFCGEKELEIGLCPEIRNLHRSVRLATHSKLTDSTSPNLVTTRPTSFSLLHLSPHPHGLVGICFSPNYQTEFLLHDPDTLQEPARNLAKKVLFGFREGGLQTALLEDECVAEGLRTWGWILLAGSADPED